MTNVKIYSTPACPWCHKAKDFFTKNEIVFKDINVADDDVARDDMVEKSGQMGVPVIDIDGTIIIGFDESKLKELLHLD